MRICKNYYICSFPKILENNKNIQADPERVLRFPICLAYSTDSGTFCFLLSILVPFSFTNLHASRGINQSGAQSHSREQTLSVFISENGQFVHVRRSLQNRLQFPNELNLFKCHDWTIN